MVCPEFVKMERNESKSRRTHRIRWDRNYDHIITVIGHITVFHFIDSQISIEQARGPMLICMLLSSNHGLCVIRNECVFSMDQRMNIKE